MSAHHKWLGVFDREVVQEIGEGRVLCLTFWEAQVIGYILAAATAGDGNLFSIRRPL